MLVVSRNALAADRSNIVLVMADDLGIECLNCYGGSSYQTPHLDKLAQGGMRFTHAYSQPLCTPTRVQIMTGRYNHRNWVAFGLLDPGERTFGHLMSEAGYRTCIAGKWQLQSYDPPDFPNAAKRRGIGMPVSAAGFDQYSVFHAWDTEDKGSRYANPTYDRNGTITQVDGGYGPDTSVDFILDFLTRDRQQPAFVYYAMSLPHWPMVPTPDSAEWQQEDRRLEEDTRYFADMVAYTDKVVGRLVDGITRAGLRENTLLLFYSDNGTDTRITSQFRGQAIRGGKASPQQTGIRVPLIASWPGTIEAGQTCADLIDASDFLPTLAGLAGAKIPADWQHDGVSFLPALRGVAGPKREACFFWYDPRPGWDKERFSRHIFALDHNYKLFLDGSLFDIRGEGLRESRIPRENESAAATAARAKLQRVISESLKPPRSPAADRVVDAYGNPVK